MPDQLRLISARAESDDLITVPGVPGSRRAHLPGSHLYTLTAVNCRLYTSSYVLLVSCETSWFYAICLMR
jgi:hypothetical protein